MGRPKGSGVEPIQTKFYNNVYKTPTCWFWIGRMDGVGYGQIQYRDKREGAHRISYMLENGYIRGDKFVCHSCDTPQCVNPDHLFMADHDGNMADFKRKGYGIGHNAFKLICKHGHSLSGARVDPSGRRICRECNRLRQRTADSGVSNARKTHCPSGHPYVEGNLYQYGTHRQCKACKVIRWESKKGIR